MDILRNLDVYRGTQPRIPHESLLKQVGLEWIGAKVPRHNQQHQILPEGTNTFYECDVHELLSMLTIASNYSLELSFR